MDGMLDADEAYFKEHKEPLFSSHMIDLSEESVEENLETTAKYLKRAAPMKQWLEMEIGITGGEEDGVDNTGVDNNSLYTQPEDIYNIYNTLKPISPYFSIAAGFGNVHGVYKPGNVKLHPELLGKHQAYVKEKDSSVKGDKPVYLVFHGGSGSTVQEFKDAISYGVVKVNLDTDLQYAYLTGIRTTFLTRKTTSCPRSVTQMERTSPTRSTTIHVCGFVRARRPCRRVSRLVSTTSTLLVNCKSV